MLLNIYIYHVFFIVNNHRNNNPLGMKNYKKNSMVSMIFLLLKFSKNSVIHSCDKLNCILEFRLRCYSILSYRIEFILLYK